jgi:hypothetical protein
MLVAAGLAADLVELTSHAAALLQVEPIVADLWRVLVTRRAIVDDSRAGICSGRGRLHRTSLTCATMAEVQNRRPSTSPRPNAASPPERSVSSIGFRPQRER